MQKRVIAVGAGMFAALILAVAGCQPAEDKATKDSVTKSKEEPSKVAAKGKHDGWWCKEHGIPEDECSMCSAEVEKQCKAKGDWCEKHDRAKSQCFICDPALKEKFAAKYRAKYGKEPPPIEDDKEEKKDDKTEPVKKDGDKANEKKDGK